MSEQQLECDQRATPLELFFDLVFVFGFTQVATVVTGGTRLPALVSLTLTAVVWMALHAYELIWWRVTRAEARAQRLPTTGESSAT